MPHSPAEQIAVLQARIATLRSEVLQTSPSQALYEARLGVADALADIVASLESSWSNTQELQAQLDGLAEGVPHTHPDLAGTLHTHQLPAHDHPHTHDGLYATPIHAHADLADATHTHPLESHTHSLEPHTHPLPAHAHDEYATDVELLAHTAAADPHPDYLTQAEADQRYSQQGSGGAPAACCAPLLLPLMAASAVATNNALNAVNAVSDPNLRQMANLSGITKARIQGRIGGTLAPATKIRLQYHLGGNPAVATGDAGWTTLADTAGAHTTGVMFYSGELVVPAAARVNNVLIRPVIFSGDGAADPTITACVVNFYA